MYAAQIVYNDLINVPNIMMLLGIKLLIIDRVKKTTRSFIVIEEDNSTLIMNQKSRTVMN